MIAGLTILVVSYTANSGLPFVSTYNVSVELPNAQRLQRDSDVRIAGLRVGDVQGVSAVRGPHGQTFAKIQLALSPSVGHLPIDTRVQEEPASILGASYLQLTLGHGAQRVPPGGTLPLAQSAPTVQLTDLLDVFDSATSLSIRRSLNELGNGLAGRGVDLNETIASVSQLLGPLTRVTAALASRAADLSRLISGLAGTAAALGPVSDALGGVISNGAVTLAALDSVRPALGATLDTLPGVEQDATAALTTLNPSLVGLANLAKSLQPAARIIPTAVPLLNGALEAGIRPLREVPGLAGELHGTLVALDRLARDSHTPDSVLLLTHAVQAVTTLLGTLDPAQIQCNVIAIEGYVFSKDLWQGTSLIPFAPVDIATIGANNEILQNAAPSANLHVNYLPNENYQECEAGNEPYNSNTRDLTNPAGNQPNTTLMTTPPGNVAALAAGAGLLKKPAGL